MRIWRCLIPVAALAIAHTICAQGNDLGEGSGRSVAWPEVWGDLGLTGIVNGERMAPNGVPFDPLFMSDLNFNLGLLPKKKLYFFLEGEFWAQRASAGITNPDQGRYDFSKREVDFNIGIAWNFFNRFEIRATAYALNNLNRGTSKTRPFGFQDGVQSEARYYFKSENNYDIGRLGFVGIGYYATQTLIGGDGMGFRPGLSARAYETYNIPALRSYFYGDGRLIAERPATVRLLTLDAGIATRPFAHGQNFELRVGNEVTADVQANTTRDLTYGAIRINFSSR
jgi:hypothetical protein